MREVREGLSGQTAARDPIPDKCQKMDGWIGGDYKTMR